MGKKTKAKKQPIKPNTEPLPPMEQDELTQNMDETLRTPFGLLSFVVLTRIIPVLASDMSKESKFHVLMALWFCLICLKGEKSQKEQAELQAKIDKAGEKLGTMVFSFIQHWTKEEEQGILDEKGKQKLASAVELFKAFFEQVEDDEPVKPKETPSEEKPKEEKKEKK